MGHLPLASAGALASDNFCLQRRTAVLDGTKLPNGKWNDEYWAKVDERIEIYNSNIKKGEDGDPDALALARA